MTNDGGTLFPQSDQPSGGQGSRSGDVPTIGQPGNPLDGAPPQFAVPPFGPPAGASFAMSPPPTIAPPPVGPPVLPASPPTGPRSSGTGAVALAIAGVLAVAVAAAALFLALSNANDDTATSTTSSTSTSASTTSTDTPTSAPTSAPTTPAPTIPTTVATNPGAATGAGDAIYGSYVAMLWSDVVSNVDPAEVQRIAAEKQSQYGVTTSIVYGDDFLSLRDGTVGVVFAGGFSSPRDAANWCWDRGERELGCFGVGLNDTYTENDRNGTGRMYVNER